MVREELKRKLLFTLLALVIYRIGAHIAAPGVNVTDDPIVYAGRSPRSVAIALTDEVTGLVGAFATMVAAMRRLRKLAETEPLAQLIEAEIAPEARLARDALGRLACDVGDAPGAIEAMTIIGDVKDRAVLIVDDEVLSGSTLILDGVINPVQVLGPAIAIDASMNQIESGVEKPTANMWWPHTRKPRKAIATIE